jgi:hypothetical protein
MHLAPTMYYGRPKQNLKRSATRMLASGAQVSSSDFAEVKAWLEANIDEPEYVGPNVDRAARNAKRAFLGGLGLTLFPPAFLAGVGVQLAAFASLYARSQREVVRIVRSTYWERVDPVTHLSPGSTLSTTTRYTSGLSATVTAELAHSLGQELGTSGVLTIKTKMDTALRVGGSLTTSTEKSVSRTLELRNTTSDRNRLFAIWRPGCTLSTSVLRVVGEQLAWEHLNDYEYLTDADVVTTSIDLPIRGKTRRYRLPRAAR